jgi:hypothetical protein
MILSRNERGDSYAQLRLEVDAFCDNGGMGALRVLASNKDILRRRVGG